ncbi:hypothetical protein CPC08DRAFT_348703 [Agrocybe pediades]|nr:hypothetical protein CPC08DRAFT_348703 [Agrocybe pediades]
MGGGRHSLPTLCWYHATSSKKRRRSESRARKRKWGITKSSVKSILASREWRREEKMGIKKERKRGGRRKREKRGEERGKMREKGALCFLYRNHSNTDAANLFDRKSRLHIKLQGSSHRLAYLRRINRSDFRDGGKAALVVPLVRGVFEREKRRCGNIDIEAIKKGRRIDTPGYRILHQYSLENENAGLCCTPEYTMRYPSTPAP